MILLYYVSNVLLRLLILRAMVRKLLFEDGLDLFVTGMLFRVIDQIFRQTSLCMIMIATHSNTQNNNVLIYLCSRLKESSIKDRASTCKRGTLLLCKMFGSIRNEGIVSFTIKILVLVHVIMYGVRVQVCGGFFLAVCAMYLFVISAYYAVSLHKT